MNLGNVTISIPFIQCQIEVSHSTSRQSTAIEWLILEVVLQNMQHDQEWFGNVFEEIFMIADANQLVLPCIINLVHQGALEADNLHDNVDLNSYSLNNIKVTPAGRELHKNGRLPATLSFNNIQMWHMPVSNELLQQVSDKLSPSPAGVPAMDEDFMDTSVFPEPRARDILLQERETAWDGKCRYNWLMPDTRLEAIHVIQQTPLWQNILRDLTLGADFSLSVEDEPPELAARVLDFLAAEQENKVSNNLPRLSPDMKIQEVFRNGQELAFIDEQQQKDTIAIFAKPFGKPEKNQKTKKRPAQPGLEIICQSEKFSIEITDERLLVRVPEPLLPDNVLYLSPHVSVQRGVFNIHAGSAQAELALPYSAPPSVEQVSEIISKIIFTYLAVEVRIIFLWPFIGQKKKFMEVLEKMCLSQTHLDARFAFIEKINREYRRIFNESAAVPEIALNLDELRQQSSTLSGAIDVFAFLKASAELKNRKDLLQIAFRTALESLPVQEKLDDLHELWNFVKTWNPTLINYADTAKLTSCLYGKSAIRQLLQKFDQGDYPHEGLYTSVEKLVQRMKLFAQQLLNLLGWSEQDLPASQESTRELVLSQKDKVGKLNRLLSIWRDCSETFVTEFGPISFYGDTSFVRFDHFMRSLEEILTLFYGDATKFDRIVIADTSALISNPNLLSMFGDARTMLVIPLLVLSELDGLKSENSERGRDVRAAIRQIAEYKSEQWLNIKEKSQPELLTADLELNNDAKILSIAVKYIVKNPLLLTDDLNFAMIAKAHGITALSPTEYHRQETERKNMARQDVKKRKRRK